MCQGCHGVKPEGAEEGRRWLVCFVQGAKLASLTEPPVSRSFWEGTGAGSAMGPGELTPSITQRRWRRQPASSAARAPLGQKSADEPWGWEAGREEPFQERSAKGSAAQGFPSEAQAALISRAGRGAAAAAGTLLPGLLAVTRSRCAALLHNPTRAPV